MIAAMDAGGEKDRPLGVVFEPGWRRVCGIPKSCAQLFAWMETAKIDTLHIHASALPLMELPTMLEPPRPGQKRERHPFVVYDDGKTGPLAPYIQHTHDDRAITIGAYQDGAGDPFADAEDAAELVHAHVLFKTATKGWEYKHSAIMTGWNLMHAPWRYGKRKARLDNSGFSDNTQVELSDERAITPLSQVEVPYGSWERDVLTTLKPHHRLPYVHAYDVNGQRLSACARLSLGLGGIEQIKGGKFDKKLPGYHYVTAIDHHFPGFTPSIMEPGWHTTPRVAMAEYLGIDFAIGRSIVWKEHAPYLNPWYERMRDARTFLMERKDEPAARIALDALKQCYLQPLGRLRSKRAQESGDPFYRPHWYDAVIGQELAREYKVIHDLASAGHYPLAVYYDTLILESDDPDPIRGAPMWLKLSDQLGKYKPLGTLPYSLAHIALYDGDDGSVSKLIKLLKSPPSFSDAAYRLRHYRPIHGGYPG